MKSCSAAPNEVRSSMTLPGHRAFSAIAFRALRNRTISQTVTSTETACQKKNALGTDRARSAGSSVIESKVADA